MQESIFKLRNGRSLSYAVHGRPEDRPVLYFHGTPSSRREPLLLNVFGQSLDALLLEAGLRLIAIDRPGLGFSTFNPKGDFLSFADDVKEFCERNSIPPCPVLCWSGGGPYALALAWKHPKLIQSVHIICSFTRRFSPLISSQMGMNKWYFWASKYTPRFLRLSMNLLSRKHIKSAPPRAVTGLAEVDYHLLSDPAQLEKFLRLTLKAAVHIGARGAVYEAKGYFREFGFPLRGITQPVHYWWGTQDNIVIRQHPETLERELPRAVMHYREGEGHLSLYVNCFKEILHTVCETAAGAA